jgi:Xaa-Pro aminopeptidase
LVTTVSAGRRIEAARSLMATNDVDLLIASPGADMAYLAGYFGHASERPALLLIPRHGEPSIVMALFESRSLPDYGGAVNILTYTETQDGFDMVRAATASSSEDMRRVAVSDQVWGRFLLRLQSLLKDAEFANASGYLRELRMRKDDSELDLLRSAAERTDRALETVLQSPIQGQTEVQVAARLARAMQENGLSDTFTIVCSGPNGASPHHLSSERVIDEGDVVVMDFGGVFKGYHSDITRTYCVGQASPEARKVYEVVKKAQQTGVDSVRPGTAGQDVDRATRAVIGDAGYGEAFIHRTGHGIGLDVHEDPFMVEGESQKLDPGMTVTIEPGIYLEGRFGVRIEDTVAVTATGSERLNHVPRDLRIVP